MRALLAAALAVVSLSAAAGNSTLNHPIRNSGNNCASKYTLNIHVFGDPVLGTFDRCEELCYPQTRTGLDAQDAEIVWRALWRSVAPDAVGVTATTTEHEIEVPEPGPGW